MSGSQKSVLWKRRFSTGSNGQQLISVAYSKQVDVLTGGALGALDFLPTLILTIAEPRISNPTAITQMENFPTVELS